MMDRNGEMRVLRGNECMSRHFPLLSHALVFSGGYAPSMSFTNRLRSWKPIMSSCSELPCPSAFAFNEDLDTLSPRLLARVESREENEGAGRAHREFLRITEVTDRISESRMCLAETERTDARLGPGKSILDCRKQERSKRMQRKGWACTRRVALAHYSANTSTRSGSAHRGHDVTDHIPTRARKQWHSISYDKVKKAW